MRTPLSLHGFTLASTLLISGHVGTVVRQASAHQPQTAFIGVFRQSMRQVCSYRTAWGANGHPAPPTGEVVPMQLWRLAARKGKEEVAKQEEDEEEEDEEEEGGLEYDPDLEEEELPEALRKLMEREPMSLNALLEEAGMEFGDPTLMQEEAMTSFRAGFVTILGSPNVGKSTLMNALVGERVSIVSPKQQTTRHQIMGVVTGEDFQIVYYDTPGVLRPNYRLQEGMMAYVKESLSDADLVLMMTDVFENPDEFADQEIFAQMRAAKRPMLLAVNKVDVFPNATSKAGKLGKEMLAKLGNVDKVIGRWQAALPSAEIIPISALDRQNLTSLLDRIKHYLPVGPPLYPNDTLTDRPQRFFASEIIREKIFFEYSKEIPYSCEVAVTAFKDLDRILKINATIFTERESHVPIILGTKGSKIKTVATQAREDLEVFFDKKVYLEMRVTVKKDWRTRESELKAFGYIPEL